MTPSYFKEFSKFAPVDALAQLLALPWLAVTPARKEYFMSDVPRKYTYGRDEFARTYESNPFSDLVHRYRLVLNVPGVHYNVCFLNRYDEQRNQLGWHADDSPEMDHDHPIAVVSFGAEREIWWRKKDEGGVVPAAQRQVLHHGSLFVMPAGFQQTHQHRIPKADRAVGVRVSLTFRRYAVREAD